MRKGLRSGQIEGGGASPTRSKLQLGVRVRKPRMDTSSNDEPFRGESMHSMEQSDMVDPSLFSLTSLESSCESINPLLSLLF